MTVYEHFGDDMIKRTYSPDTRNVLNILGSLIQIHRKRARMTLSVLADRAGVSVGLIRRLESGDPKCEIGVAFEVAHLLGIALWSSPEKRAAIAEQLQDKLASLPASVRQPTKVVSNEF